MGIVVVVVVDVDVVVEVVEVDDIVDVDVVVLVEVVKVEVVVDVDVLIVVEVVQSLLHPLVLGVISSQADTAPHPDSHLVSPVIAPVSPLLLV